MVITQAMKNSTKCKVEGGGQEILFIDEYNIYLGQYSFF